MNTYTLEEGRQLCWRQLCWREEKVKRDKVFLPRYYPNMILPRNRVYELRISEIQDLRRDSII
ncbi:MAG: hypothetical protein F6K39_34380 [Okeania sp. SIO3B3]|nr:hypothetical protein [Okeania sp. SIO3B3]